ncbi:hypothetical protein ACFCYN_25150 [Gottfriedia sp. NPDC056225]|uniref:hypothetical protein n=1 Tax=Gottfriedia sp. NPDC056225 TaxID=3345751 RepID=UPI0035D94027
MSNFSLPGLLISLAIICLFVFVVVKIVKNIMLFVVNNSSISKAKTVEIEKRISNLEKK